MAMPNGNFVISDKMQFHGGGAAVGGEIHHPRPWFPDERDGFISWLKAEFAAANAIIDTLCHHLRAVSDPGVYDPVLGCVHQRRVNWSHVLHMQQYFPISEITMALQQVTWMRQQRSVEQSRVGGKEFRRPGGFNGFGSRQGQYRNLGVDNRNQNVNAFVPGSLEKKGTVKEKDGAETGYDARKFDEKCVPDVQNVTDASLKSEVDRHPCTESPSEDVKDEKSSNSEEKNNLLVEKNGDVVQNQSEKNLIVLPKAFSAMETVDGKLVNVAEGLNLYEKLCDEAEVSKLISLVNDLRDAGRRGQLLGSTFVESKRPFGGHGREMIQLGVPIPDFPCDENPAKDRRVEPIPNLLQELIDRFMNMQHTQFKPDSCIVDIFYENNHSQPHSLPLWYGRPLCVLSLNDCDMVFGTAISADRPGTYRGALRINFAPGSLLVMQGNSTDIAKRAIPSIRKERVLITFAKFQPRKPFQPDHHHHHQPRHHSQVAPPNWGPPSPPPNRSPPNHLRPKHYVPVQPTGAVPAPPPMRAQLPLYVPPPPVPTTMAFPAPMRGPPPRVPVPAGTGVFLPPPGAGGPTTLAAAETSPKKEQAQKEDGNGSGEDEVEKIIV